MTNVAKWSVSAGNNSDPPPAGAPEHMLRSDVNDVMREMMAAVRRWYEVTNAEKVATGTNAYVLATSNGFAALTDLPILVFRVQNGNTAACTLNVDNLGVKNFFKFPGTVSPAVPPVPFSAGDLLAGQIVVAAYNTANGYFEMVGGRSPRDAFVKDTVIIFKMATPPVGWSPVITDHDAALRVVNDGTGGGVGGTTAASVVFTSRTIAQANLPNIDFMGITLTGDVTNNSATITNLSANPATAGWAVGNLLRGAGIPNGTTIASMTANSVVMTVQAVSTNTGTAIQAAVPTATLVAAVPTSIANGTAVVRNLREQNFVSGSFGNQGGLADAFKGLAGSTNAPDMNNISLNSGLVNFIGSHIYLNGNVAQVPMDFAVKYVNVIPGIRL